MHLEKGSATVPVALFGVSPNRLAQSDSIHHLVCLCERCRPVGGTPTGAVETTALPVNQLHGSD